MKKDGWWSTYEGKGMSRSPGGRTARHRKRRLLCNNREIERDGNRKFYGP